MRLSRSLFLAVPVLATSCWDFTAAVERCKQNPMLCLGGTGGGGPAVGEAAAGPTACSDGLDNDSNGSTDCADLACRGAVCRPAAGDCDLAELCVDGACPSDAVAPDTQSCRGDAGPCDVEERCDGLAASCPGNAFIARDTPCGVASPGSCEVAATCDGNSAACPTNGTLGAGAVCRPAADVCDVEERCTGTRDCPPDLFLAGSVLCRPSDAGCDVGELCPGDAGTCPADGVRPLGFSCRAPVGFCDRAEACTGAGKACPPDVVACDAGLYCDGNTNACAPKHDAGVPCMSDIECRSGTCADLVCCSSACAGGCAGCNELGSPGTCAPKASTTLCRPIGGACDVPERCTGSSLGCPADLFVDAGAVCRASAGPCDVEEACPGSSAQCPGDVKAPSTTLCRGSGGSCDVPDSCDAVSPLCPNDRLADAGVPCRPAGPPCDAPESCTGMSNQCPVDGLLPAGSACGAPMCNLGQTFPPPACSDAGVCTPGSPGSCNGYLCASGTTCLTSCTDVAGCAGSHSCDGGACLPKPGLGTACSGPSTCSSGNCADMVCCDQPCAGPCEHCNSSGACVPWPAGDFSEGNCNGYTCDGMGGCHSSCVGQAACSNFCVPGSFCGDAGACVPDKAAGNNRCTDNCECALGFCRDGYCCNEDCSPGCKSCGLATTQGACSNHPANTDPEAACGLYTCSGGACATNCSGGVECSPICKSIAYCNGNFCLPDLSGAVGCNNSCVCGTCYNYWQDSDGDTWANTSVSAAFCAQPSSGWVNPLTTPGIDCCDSDVAANPGQGAFFTTARLGCGGYDYNCDGSEEKADYTSNACNSIPSCTPGGGGFCDNTTGYIAGNPACGAVGSYRATCNSVTCAGGDRCATVTATSVRQSCR